MSHLIEALGKGLVGDLYAATAALFPSVDADEPEERLGEEHDDHSDPDFVVRLACVHMARNDNTGLSRARELFELAARLAPENLAGNLGQACVADRLGQNATAVHHLEQAVIRRRDDPVLLFALGASCEKLGQSERAERIYEDTLRDCPALRNARERLAALQMTRGDLESAAFQYALLRAGRPQQIGPHLILGNLHLIRGETAAAAESFEDALTVEADCCPSRDDQAAVLAARGRFAEAIRWLEDARERDPVHADFSLRIGDLLLETGRDDEALQEYLRAVQYSPEFLEACVKTGTQLLRMGRYGDASRWFTRAVEINDRLVVGYVGLALARLELGETRSADETLQMAAGIEPNSTLLFSEAARLSLRSAEGGSSARNSARFDFGDRPSRDIAQRAASVSTVAEVVEVLDSLIDHMGEWLERRPNHAAAHYRRGVLLRSRGRIEEANAALTSTVRINPVCSRALIKLGLGLHELGQHEHAWVQFRQAFGFDRRSFELHHQFALLFTQQPRFDLACDQYSAQLGSRVDWVDPAANMGLALENLGLIETEPPFAFGDDAVENRFGGADADPW